MITVNCFCSGTTFPNGEATNNRIIMIGKALRMKDCDLFVYANSEGNKNQFNTQREGTIDGITYQHLNKDMRLGLPRWKRIKNYFIVGFFNSFLVIRRLAKDRRNIIYLYSHGSIFNAWISILAHLYNVPVIQEVNEWNDDIEKSRLHAFIYKKIMFRWSKGAIIISDNIAVRIKEHLQPDKAFKMFMLPVLADKNDWIEIHQPVAKTFVWCGLIEGYFKDVLFMIDGFSLLHRQYPDYTLVICGKYKPETATKITAKLQACGMPSDRVQLTGFITNEQLVNYCQTATALIAPLWNDQASIARFPTKIASFLFSKRPIITCQVGEVGKHLTDGKTALFYKAADESDLAAKIRQVIDNPAMSDRIGEQGMKLAHDKLDYRAYANELVDFFNTTA